MIAIVASPKDLHARRVAQELESLGHRPRFIDTREFGQGALIHYPIMGDPEITPAEAIPSIAGTPAQSAKSTPNWNACRCSRSRAALM